MCNRCSCFFYSGDGAALLAADTTRRDRCLCGLLIRTRCRGSVPRYVLLVQSLPVPRTSIPTRPVLRVAFTIDRRQEYSLVVDH